ncbi:MAG: YgiT-type zinc finger protein [Bacteroidota bacterium]|jgi:YgiT-type zinc finger domain-containing protein
MISQCNICGSNEVTRRFVNQAFDVKGEPVLVENIPALVCVRCSDATFALEVSERIRKMIHGESKPVRSIAVDVFDYA